MSSLQGSGVALVVGIAGTLWAGFGVVLAGEEAIDRAWNVPDSGRPSFLASRLRALGLLAGAWFVSHEIRNATPVYGTFALVIGLLNAVRERRLWPRSLLGTCTS